MVTSTLYFPYIIAITLISALLASFAQYIFKRNIKKFKISISEILRMIFSKSIFIGLLIYILSLCVYIFALHYGELSFVYPFFASTFVFVALLSKYRFGERISAVRVLGILLIIFGIIITALTY